jgi:hypothetical protein
VTDLATVHNWPSLDRPVLVMAMEGWIDAGFASASAMSALLSATPNTLVADFDSDALIDHRARRPVMRIVNGVLEGLRWPVPTLRATTGGGGRSLLLLSGPEPDMRWHEFTREVVQLGLRLGVEMVVGLGAFPAPVPHTRSVRLAATASTPDLAGRVGFIPATIEVPSGVQSSLQHGFGQAGVPSVGLWARVPHYVSAMPYPAASAALLEELGVLAGLEIDTSTFRAAATQTAQQIDDLVAGSEEHATLVHQLERQHDEEQGLSATNFGDLPSGDELAAELERFLRGEQQ